MTTSAVSQINLFGNAQNAASNVKNGQNDSFSQIFASQAETKSEANVETAKTEEPRKVNDSEEVNETEVNAETNDVQEAAKEKTDEIDMEKTDKVLSEEEVKEATEELITKIAEVMNVTPQDIQNALEELGLKAQDLLNTENIPALVVALTEGADELSVMTNEEVFANVQEITAKAEELLAGLSEVSGMSFTEIQEAMAKMAEHNPVAEEDVVYTNANPSDAVTADELAVTLENSNATEVQSVPKETRDNRQGAANDNANNQQMNFAQTVAERLEQAVAKTDAVTSSYTTTTESIMNQIQDAIHVIQTQDMTEMELQLHPASLGNLRIQIAAKEGVVTAVFTTENEAVRAALESQLITLKDNFAQQGVRVEAVEVTVASHAFEQNLNGDESQAGGQTPEKKRGSRRITLSDLTTDNLEEELSDEDRIVAEMMRENGNTVDYTV